MQRGAVGRRTAFVLGSGIAGLSLAEILSRNGWKITLIDSATELGGDASRATQNWLHTGWLYAGLPSASAMQACATSLRLFGETYGAALPPDVVNVVADETGIAYTPSTRGWFSPERIHYAFAISSKDLSPLQKVGWKPYLDSVILSRLRRLGYSTEALDEVPQGLARLMSQWEGDDPAGYTKYRVIRSTDARIDTRRVLSSLLKLLGEDTEVVLGAECELLQRGSRTAIRVDGEVHTPDLCVLAAGKSLPRLLAQIGRDGLGKDFKSIASPIVVLRRALDLPSFIRFTPNLPETVNHIRYDVGGVDVSTIGSYDFHPVDDRPDISPFVQKVCQRLGVSTSEVLGSYYGTKTELTGKLARRFNHAVDAVNDNTFFAIAGKFSQFPLLVNDFAAKLGLRVDLPSGGRGALAMDIADSQPERLARAAGITRRRDDLVA